jgi:hypothetical protein
VIGVRTNNGQRICPICDEEEDSNHTLRYLEQIFENAVIWTKGLGISRHK